jgi:hypothetical protein
VRQQLVEARQGVCLLQLHVPAHGLHLRHKRGTQLRIQQQVRPGGRLCQGHDALVIHRLLLLAAALLLLLLLLAACTQPAQQPLLVQLPPRAQQVLVSRAITGLNQLQLWLQADAGACWAHSQHTTLPHNACCCLVKSGEH